MTNSDSKMPILLCDFSIRFVYYLQFKVKMCHLLSCTKSNCWSGFGMTTNVDIDKRNYFPESKEHVVNYQFHDIC